MPLTPAEQEELTSIQASLSAMDEADKGAQAVDTVRAARAPAVPAKPRPFSLYRAGVGALRDGVQGIVDTVDDLGDSLGSATGIGGLTFGSRAKNGILGYEAWDTFNRNGGDVTFGKAGDHALQFGQPEGSENAGTAERTVRSIGSFLVPFTASMRVLRGLGALGVVGRAAQGMAAGAVADFSQIDPVGGNIANILTNDFGVTNGFVKSLASEDDDTALEARFKAAASGAAVGVLADGVLSAGGKLARLYRDWKGTAEEAKAVIDNIKKGSVKIEPVSPRKTATSAADAADGEIPVVEADAIYDPMKPIMVERQPENFEDVVDFLRSKAGDPNIDPELFSRLAKNLAEGDPENALAKLGIDPAKLDYSGYSDPARLGRLQKGLQDIFETIAGGLGRTGTRVNAEALVRGSEALASTPDVLKSLYGSTSKLAETLMASRMFVGGHAHQLLDLADRALKELETQGVGPEWIKFLEAFHRHAYFLGALRGAGTEVGRALQSLQTLAKAGGKKLGAPLDAALAGEAASQSPKSARLTIEDGASAFADTLTTDGERIAALRRLKDLRGDVSELSRTVREGNGSVFKRINGAVKETMGSLFGLSTATYNIGAGLTFLGLNGLGRVMALIARSPGFLMGGKANAEARRAAVEAWAYADSVVTGFREAYSNTIAVLEHELYDELRINLDGIGLEGLAKKAAAKSTRGAADATARFERADVVNNKAFSLTAAESKRLRDFAGSVPGPKFFQASLRGLVNVLGASVNVTGSLYRSGTTLFINLPDEFVGTLATRAGASSQAVRLAAREATDLGLEGPQLGEFLKSRAVQLYGQGPAGLSPAGFEGGAAHAVARAGETEAKAVLFQDDLEWGINRGAARLVNSTGGLGSLLIPFVKTPMRIIERTAIDFTPLGLFKGRIRQAIAAGGGARDEAIARMGLGITALITAYNLAEDRQIVGYDGGYASSARDVGRPSYSLKIGDDTYEFSRLDPIGTLLGMGADLRAFIDAQEDDPDGTGSISEMGEGLVWAIAANVLSKSWLTSIRQLTDLAGATSAEDADTRWDKFKTGIGSRFVPASGIQKVVEQWGDSQLREAASFTDGLMRASLGADSLPVKRDALGNPLEMQGMTRLAGVRGSVMPDPQTDPLSAELESLSIRRPIAARTQKGVKLDATQFSRFLQLRGQEVRDPSTGLTMQEALDTLVRLPEYQSLPKAARVAEIKKAMDGYTAKAVDAYTNEDKRYAYARLREEVFTEGELQGWGRPEKEAKSREFADKLGIPHD